MRIVVIGAGVVGLAVARELAIKGHELFVVDRESHVGAGITSRNSEVIHAGIYYAPSSLKAKLCVEGRDLTYAYLQEKQVAFNRCGKLVVAITEAEIDRLNAVRTNAAASGVDDLETLSSSDVRRLEPSVKCAAALLSERTGVMDSHGMVRALRGDLERHSGTVILHTTVLGADRTTEGFRLTLRTGEELESIDCEAVINSAGLYSDTVARLATTDDSTLPALRYVKGSYARLWWPKLASVPPSRLVYPLPEKTGPGLGIHLTIDLADDLRLGPDVYAMAERVEDYCVPDYVTSKFLVAAETYLDLPAGAEITPDYCGIRPVRVDETGDFYIEEESRRGLPGWVNLIGIESPGLTAALAIGKYVGTRWF